MIHPPRRHFLTTLTAGASALFFGNASQAAKRSDGDPPEPYRAGRILYENPLASDADIAGFRMEGPGVVSFPRSRMRMENGIDINVSDPKDNQAANIVHWCPESLPADIEISWDFWPVRAPGLCILFFAAKGRKGQNVFDSSLAERNGPYSQYHHDGSLPKNAFYAMRKNPGLGRIGGFLAGDFADYARADGRFPLGDPSLNAAFHRKTPQYRSACSPSDNPADPTYCEPAVKADRMMMFIKGSQDSVEAPNPYFVIVDDYNIDDKVHTYRWRWHAPAWQPARDGKQKEKDATPNDFTIEGEGSIPNPFRIYNPQVKRATLELTFLAPADYEYEIGRYEPVEGVSHPIMEVTKHTINPVYMAIVFPRKQGFVRPRIAPLDVSGDGAAGGTIRWSDDVVDTVVTGRGSDITGAELSTNARMATVRTVGGAVSEYAIGEGNRLTFRSQTLLAELDGNGNVSMSGNELALSGAIVSGRFYGPDVDTLRVGQREATFERNGKFIEYHSDN